MSNEPLRFVYSDLGDEKSKDLTNNVEKWLKEENYNKIFNSPELINYVYKISKTQSSKSSISEDDWFAMAMLVLWKNIHQFKLDKNTNSPVGKFKTWVKLSMNQVFNYTGKYYRHFVNMSSCGQGFGDLSDSPYKNNEGALTNDNFTLNVLVKEKLEELNIKARDEKIIKQYYYDNDTQKEVADDFNLSRRRIREILEKI